MSENGDKPVQSEGMKVWTQNVKDTLEKLDKKVDKLDEKVTKHREETLVDVTTIKAKAGIMGVVAGFVVSTIMSIIVGLIVYQLTIGNHQVIKPHKHEAPDIPVIPDVIGYVLPPRETEHEFYFVDKEADV
jgi:hypothetical protein